MEQFRAKPRTIQGRIVEWLRNGHPPELPGGSQAWGPAPKH
jgi:hypothetical protein